MEKLFAALRDLNPGFEVVDVRFLVGQSASENINPDEIDAAFGAAVAGSTDFEWASVN